MTLEDALSTAHGLDGLTLFQTSKGWQASSRWDENAQAWRVHHDANPVIAILRALGRYYEEANDDVEEELDLLG